MKFNYLEEIKPLWKYVTVYNDNGAHPNQKIKQQLSDIYDRLRKSESEFIYGKANVDIHPIDLGCSTCITNMMRHLFQWHKRISDRNTVEFKGVPQKKVVKEEVIKSFNTKDLHKYVDPDLNAYEKTLYPKMKWGEFKTYCKEQGINTKSKKRTQLEDELKTL